MVAHADVAALWTVCSEGTTVVPRASVVVVPSMSAAVGVPEVRTSEVEIVAIRVAGIDAEVPVACIPVERTIEVGSCAVGCILPVEENIAQIEVTASPVCSIKVVARVDAHQIVEVHLVGSFVLLFGEVQLVSHLVGEEQSLLASLLVAHCVG